MGTRSAAESVKLKEQLEEALKEVRRLENEKKQLTDERDHLQQENTRLWSENAALKTGTDTNTGLNQKMDAMMGLLKDTHMNTKVLVDVHGPSASTYAAAVKGSGSSSAKPRPPLIIPSATARRSGRGRETRRWVGRDGTRRRR